MEPYHIVQDPDYIDYYFLYRSSKGVRFGTDYKLIYAFSFCGIECCT